MMNWLKVKLFWRRFDPRRPPGGPVMVHWSRASGSVKLRIGLWCDSRVIEGRDWGPGFVDYWSGKPLASFGEAGRLYWRRPILR